MTLPEVGTRVTAIIDFGYARFHRGTVTGAIPDAMPGVSAFTVMFEEPNLIDGGVTHMWSIDSRSVEGVGWARGWDGPAVDALMAAEVLR